MQVKRLYEQVVRFALRSGFAGPGIVWLKSSMKTCRCSYLQDETWCELLPNAHVVGAGSIFTLQLLMMEA
ncbi:unnamed protein product [Lathyrus oleraceus]